MRGRGFTLVEVLVAVAARVGDVRLIDNMTIHVDARGAVVDLGTIVAPAGVQSPRGVSRAEPAPSRVESLDGSALEAFSA